MKKLLLIAILFATQNVLAQPWTASGTCDYTDGQQWNNGGATGCACSWYSVVGTDTLLNCAFGDCGQNALYECVYDCNGHNGWATDMVARQCDATANPICWFNGAGNAGQLFCEGIALPVELIEFKGIKDGYNNELTWSTATELNSSHFLVQNSTDGINFETVAYLGGAGTTQTVQYYQAIHLSPRPTINYYQLIQFDFDGKYEVFEMVAIDNRVIDRDVIRVVNLMGQDVDEYFKGMVIIYYDDGSIEKKIK